MVNTPQMASDDYFVEDDANVEPKHGTTVQAGWDLADGALSPKKSGDYPTDLRLNEDTVLVKFLQDGPFDVFGQHWVEREGKKSFVCLRSPRIDEECPLCDIAGDTPRNKFLFNVAVLSDGEPNTQILTAPPTLARQLRAISDDDKRGPLNKFYWAISRQGTGVQTQYILDRVRGSELAEEWELDPETIEDKLSLLSEYDASTTYVTPRDELLPIARALVS